MTVLSVSNLTLQFGTTTVFEEVSFSLSDNDKLGIVGVNGSGKTSLVKTLTGEYDATAGDVFLPRGKTVGMLTQTGAFDDADTMGGTVTEQMYRAFPELLAMEARMTELEVIMERDARAAAEYADLHERYIAAGGLVYKSRCSAVLGHLGFDAAAREQPASTLSGGQKTRLALAIRLSTEPDVLILDEPTNHLDIETMGWLEEYLAGYPKCVILISHDRYFLDRITNKTLFLQNHRGKMYPGGYRKAAALREAERREMQKKYDLQQKEIAKQQAYMDRLRRWNQEHNYVTLHSREKLLAHMERVARPDAAPRPIRMQFRQELASGGEVLTAKHLSMSYGEHAVFGDVNFMVKKGDRVMLIGPNGCGKSTLVKLLIGKLEPTAGRVEAGYHVEVGYYDQENQNLDDASTVLDELWDAYPNKTETEIRTTLAAFRFFGEEVYKTVGVLSGGERARLTLAKLILSHMNLLILDEPTNHLDIDSREVLEEALASFDGTVLVVSHDRYLVDKLATRILELKPGPAFDGDLADFHVTHPDEGNGYREYAAFKAARLEAMGGGADFPVSETVSDAKAQYLKNKQSAAEERKRKKRIETLHRESDAMETELAQIESALETETDYVKAAALDARKTEIEAALLADWEELETLERADV